MMIVISCNLLGCNSKEKEVDFFKIKNITMDKIDKVELSYTGVSTRVLSKDEVQALVKIINTSGDDEVQQYEGPDPKGVTDTLDVYLKSKNCFSMYPCRDGYLLFSGEKSYMISQPQYNDFIKNMLNSKGKV
jgi:hypothetical protein